ncbi:MAG: twitch domain-containing radical SAM protein [Gammaproteobacteria bacterium]
MTNKLPKHLTKGGPGDQYLGGGKVDTSEWFKNNTISELDKSIKNQDIYFCAAPFQLLYSDTDGGYAPCSWAEAKVFKTNIKDVSIKDWFESNTKLNQLRTEMTTPDSNLELTKKSCGSCIKQEKLYGRSRRQTSLKLQTNDTFLWPRIREAVEAFKHTGRGHIEHKIFEVQIKAFGNQCNLDCYMCHTFDSSTRTTTLNSKELEGQSVINDYTIKKGNELKKLISSIKGAKLEDIINQITEIAPFIYNLKFIGGEPLVMKQYYKLLDAIVKTKYSNQMYVKFQTNMSVLGEGKYKITDYIKHFERFEVTVSLDGIGKTDEYIRRRSNWNDIVNNIKTIKQYPNVQINLNGTISFLSVLRFDELINWFDENKKLFNQINWSNIRGPAKLCANVLPDDLKKKLIDKYKNFPDIQNVLKEDNAGLSYLDTIDYLLKIDKYYKGTKWEANLFDVFPELKKYNGEKRVKKIYSIALNLHDHNTYDGKWHNQRERHTRFKHNLPYHAEAYDHQSDILNPSDYRLNKEFVNDYWLKNKPDGTNGILAFTYTLGGIRMCKDILPKEIFDYDPKNLWDYHLKDNIYFIDHHQSHAAYAFLNSGFLESDILAIDGIGSKFRCVFFDKDYKLHDLSDKLPIGWLWNHMSNLTGFGTLGASKLMGKVGYGKHSDYYYNTFEIIFDGPITERKQEHFKEIRLDSIEDLAYTLQEFTIDKIKEHVLPLKSTNKLCLAGGVAYNGYMNEMFTEHYDDVFVPPAIGDEGQAIGTYQHADYMINKQIHKSNVYAGKEYEFVGDEKVDYREVAQAIADGKIVGWFQGKSESGNRALGNRSILADPRNPDIKDIINNTIKMREDFRPFAPAVLEEHYKEYFDTRLPSPYMSRICKVKTDKVPGITHVDGTARIQTVSKTDNEKFYKLLLEFWCITGVPMLLNTSFNCREPIVETPNQAIKTFKRTALDLLVIGDYIIRK